MLDSDKHLDAWRTARGRARRGAWLMVATTMVATLFVGAGIASAGTVMDTRNSAAAPEGLSSDLASNDLAGGSPTQSIQIQTAAVAFPNPLNPTFDKKFRIPWPEGRGAVEVHLKRESKSPIFVGVAMSTKARHYALIQGGRYVADQICGAIVGAIPYVGKFVKPLVCPFLTPLVDRVLRWLAGKDTNRCWVQYRFEIRNNTVFWLYNNNRYVVPANGLC